jgi:hypothetical protein
VLGGNAMAIFSEEPFAPFFARPAFLPTGADVAAGAAVAAGTDCFAAGALAAADCFGDGTLPVVTCFEVDALSVVAAAGGLALEAFAAFAGEALARAGFAGLCALAADLCGVAFAFGFAAAGRVGLCDFARATAALAGFAALARAVGALRAEAFLACLLADLLKMDASEKGAE